MKISGGKVTSGTLSVSARRGSMASVLTVEVEDGGDELQEGEGRRCTV